MMVLAMALGTFILALPLVGMVRRGALRLGVIDRPTDRGLHEIPTPRGGGTAIALVWLAALVVLLIRGGVVPAALAVLMVGGSAVAAVGLADDMRPLSALVRLLVHLAAGAAIVTVMGGLPRIALGPWDVQTGMAGALFAVIGIAWLVNVFNFMDGTDGMVSSQASWGAITAAFVLRSAGVPDLAWIMAVLGGASAAFLVCNWSPARLFLGDAGSGFLGYVFGAVAFEGERLAAGTGLLVLLPLTPLIADATLTIVRRVLAAHNPTMPHRDHVYQRLVRAGWTHQQVALLYLACSMTLSVPALVVRGVPIGMAMAPLPLLGLPVWLLRWHSRSSASESRCR